MDDKVSIIVPAFNVEKYIEPCLDSIVQQSYKNIELIVVDDGSTDKTPTKCDNFKLKYPDKDIKIIHQKNSGVSAARNKGLDKATGEFVTFVDGDDLLARAAIEHHIANIKDNNANVSILTIRSFTDESELTKKRRQKKIKKLIFNREEIMLRSCYDSQLSGGVANKMYARNYIGNIRFREYAITEDYFFNYEVFKQKGIRVAFSNQEDYYYRNNPNSATKSAFSKCQWDAVEARYQIVEESSKDFPEYSGLARSRLTLVASKMLVKMISSKHDDQKDYDKANDIIKKEGHAFFHNKQVPIRKRFFVKVFLVFGPWTEKRINSKAAVFLCTILEKRLG